MKTYPQAGHDLLAKLPYLSAAADIVLRHEERFDGSGYPRGLRGEAIPFHGHAGAEAVVAERNSDSACRGD